MSTRLRIIDINFTTRFDWLFKLADESGQEAYIMNELFYKNHKLKSPITKKELDYYDKGQWINATLAKVDDKFIVIR